MFSRFYPHFLFILALVLVGSETARAADRELRIGAIASLSGPASEQGHNWLLGAQLAVRDLEIEGKSVRLVVEDDATSAARAATAFEKLVNTDRVRGIVGGTWDMTAEAVFPLALRHKIPFVTPSNPVEVLAEAARGNPYVFTNGLGIAATERAMTEVFDQKKPSSVAIVVPNLPFGILHARAMERVADQHHVRITMNEIFELNGATDALRSFALRLSKAPPDLLFCVADYGSLDVFAGELERLHVSPVILTVQHLDEAMKLSPGSHRFDRALGIYPPPPVERFSDRFKALHGSEPKVFAAQGYDAVRFLARVLEGGVDVTKPGFVYEGVSGAHRITDSHQLLDYEAVVMEPAFDGKELRVAER
jgi:branched-chain amino acid transport system substrate-binding protein